MRAEFSTGVRRQEDCRLYELRADPGETADRSDAAKERARDLREALSAQAAEIQALRLNLPA